MSDGCSAIEENGPNDEQRLYTGASRNETTRRLLYITVEEHAAIRTAILRFPEELNAQALLLEGISDRYRAKWPTDDRTELARDAAELVVANVPRATTDEIADAVLVAIGFESGWEATA